MESYKKTIQMRMIVCVVLEVVVVGLIVCGERGIFNKWAGIMNEHILDYQEGLLMGIGVLALVCFIRYARAIRNSKKLQILFNTEHDERKKLIKQKAGMPIIAVTSMLMILVGIVGGYFNTTIFYTLTVAGIAQMTIGAAVKMYYLRSM